MMERLIRARTALLLDPRFAFFGSLALRLEIVESRDIPTAATNGRAVLWNPDYVARLSDPELMGVWAHEVLHCAFRHFARRAGRKLADWNVSADYAINGLIRAAGLILPAGALYDARLAAMCAEDIFAELFGPVSEPEPEAAPEPEDGQEDGEDGSEGDGPDGQEDGQEGPEDGQGGQEGDDGEDGSEPGDDGQEGGDGPGEDGADGSDGSGDGQGDDGAEPGDGSGDGQEGPETAADGSGSGDGEDGQEGPGGPGKGKGGPSAEDLAGMDPAECGGVLDEPEAEGTAETGEQSADLSAQWETYTRQAIAAAKRAAVGNVPGWIERVASDLSRPVVDWRDVLRRFVTDSLRKDYSWSRPDRRFSGQSFVLPGLVSDSMSRLVIVRDTSGSIDDGILAGFMAEVSALLDDGAADTITIIDCDTAVRQVAEFSRGDTLDGLRTLGGGGTDFAPAFAHIAREFDDSAAVVFFTDLQTYSWGIEPSCPVLFAAWGRPSDVERWAARRPFGEIVHIA